MKSLLEIALDFAANGFAVFPLKPRGKIPIISAKDGGRGFHDATTDDQQIREWWTRWPHANIGIATGASGLVVLDIDGPEGQAELLALRSRLRVTVPHTLMAATGRDGGFHAYYRGIAPSSQVKGSKLDVRGNTGYVVAPGSIHETGRTYRWVEGADDLDAIARVPEWLVQWSGNRGSAPENPGGKPAAKIRSGQGDGGASAASAPSAASKPAYLSHNPKPVTQLILSAIREPYTAELAQRIQSALAAIPPDVDGKTWISIGAALHDLEWKAQNQGQNVDYAFELWNDWSARSTGKGAGNGEYKGRGNLLKRWEKFSNPKPGPKTTIATVFALATERGWSAETASKAGSRGTIAPAISTPNGYPLNAADNGAAQASGTSHLNGASGGYSGPGASFDAGHSVNGTNGHHALPAILTAETPSNPLIRLNDEYAVIGDVGGKCLVLGWIKSKVDETVKVPSFQTFKSFSERYSHRYVTLKSTKTNKDGESETVEEVKQLGSHWLKWAERRSFEAIDLVPGGAGILPGDVLNLWSGFAVAPVPGEWPLMKRHIREVLAAGDDASALYIVRYAAWCVQNPGERAEVALTFRGEKGSGKGTFAHALRRIFGQHGLQIYNSKHLVGSFNGHLRNCLLLFADEAFWAGDKAGESVLKGMITEPALMIEHKGVDAAPWKNRLHVIMAANAEWTVPASHDERRYAVFDVDNTRKQDAAYFKPLHHELERGGLAAMLHDLLTIDLGEWHPRMILETAGLRRQKLHSLSPLSEWWETLLQEGKLPPGFDSKSILANDLLVQARLAVPRLRDTSVTAFGRFLREAGAERFHTEKGNIWRLPALVSLRRRWSEKFHGWEWNDNGDDWG